MALSWLARHLLPERLAQRRELEFAAQHFSTIELNGSFYSLQRPANYQEWSSQTPDDFVFAIKGGRFITHMRRLKNIEIPLANFFAQGLLRLGKKLGPILWQFPPNFKFDAQRMQDVLRPVAPDAQAGRSAGAASRQMDEGSIMAEH